MAAFLWFFPFRGDYRRVKLTFARPSRLVLAQTGCFLDYRAKFPRLKIRMTPNNHLRQMVSCLLVIAALATSACHREVAVPPLPYRPVTLSDRFFDVWPTGPGKAFVVGSSGKVLFTEDEGHHFKPVNIGTDAAVYAIQMTDDQNGYLCGQDGLVMRTRDGGK